MNQKLWHTVQLPVSMLREDVDVDKDLISKWDWHERQYRTMVVPVQDLVRREFIEWFYHLGLPLLPYQMLFATAPGAEGYLHKDTHPETLWNGKHCKATLNYHLTEYCGSLEWYDCPEPGEDWTTEANTPAERYVRQGHRKIDSWQGPEPALCRVDYAHAADNVLGLGPRVVLSLRFIPNPDWDIVVERMQPWIKHN